jgi:hypothetical protein
LLMTMRPAGASLVQSAFYKVVPSRSNSYSKAEASTIEAT